MDTKLFDQPSVNGNLPRNNFDRGNTNCLTIHAGDLVPVFCKRLTPNEEVNYGTEVYGRLMPLINPIYSKYKFYVYNFFVPTRLCFPHFDRFRAGKKIKRLSDNSEFTPIAPRISLAFLALSSCYDQMYKSLINTHYSPQETLNYVGIWTNSLPDYLNMPCTNEIAFASNPLTPVDSNTSRVMQINSINLVPDWDESRYPFYTLSTGDSVNPTASSYFGFGGNNTEDKVQGHRLVFIEKFIAYTLIWYDYFRDWRLEDYAYSPYDFIHDVYSDSVAGNGDFTPYFQQGIPFLDANPQLNWFSLRRRTFTSDMFISAFPTPQLGDAINIPQFTDFNLAAFDNYGQPIDSEVAMYGSGLLSWAAGQNPTNLQFVNGQGATIDDLHKAEQLQKYFQMLMVHNIKQQDLDKMFYGIQSSIPYDSPIFLHGDTFEFNFDEVLQTSQTTVDSPLGDFAGRGSVFGKTFGKTYTADEFGYFFTIVSAVPKQAYFQGIPREFTRNWDIYDLPNYMFANLGFDNIDNEEIFFKVAQNNVDDPEQVYKTNKSDFGYMTRYIDARVSNDEIHGSFRSNLNNWHDSRIFTSTPPLNKFFTNVNYLDFGRVFAVNQFEYPNILLCVKNVFNTRSSLPYYCNPF